MEEATSSPVQYSGDAGVSPRIELENSLTSNLPSSLVSNSSLALGSAGVQGR